MKTIILNQFRKVFQIPFLEQQLRNLVQGKDSQSAIGRLVPNNYQYPLSSIRKFTHLGVNLELDIHDYVSHYLYFGFKDAGHLQLMNLVKPGDVVLDIGTNYGTTILQFAKHVGKEGFCYGFEPDLLNYDICQKQIAHNSLTNIKVENIGLGEQEGSFFMVVENEANRGCNKVFDAPKNEKESTKITIKTLDSWVEENSLSQIDLIKIDVEGFEYNVLKGALKCLEEFNPTLFIELDDNNLREQNCSAKEVVMFLQNLNYLVYHSVTGEKISTASNFENCHYDVIAKYVLV